MKKIFPNKGVVLFLAILLVGIGIAWTTFQERSNEGEGDVFQTKGYVSSVRRDAIGCTSSLPFAAKDCRFVVRIYHRILGSTRDDSYIYVGKYNYLPTPAVAAGDPVTGTCSPTTGRCNFDQLKERPYGLVVALACVVAASLVGAWIYRQRRLRTNSR